MESVLLQQKKIDGIKFEHNGNTPIIPLIKNDDTIDNISASSKRMECDNGINNDSNSVENAYVEALEEVGTEGVKDTTNNIGANGSQWYYNVGTKHPVRSLRRTKHTKYGSTYAFTVKTNFNAEVFGLDKDIPAGNAFLHAQTVYTNSHDTFSKVDIVKKCAIEHLTLTQLGMKSGIKSWGQDSLEAMFKEMKQFHDLDVVWPLLPSEITLEVEKIALGCLMFLKKKWNIIIKLRGCANDRPQQIYKSNEKRSSLTVYI